MVMRFVRTLLVILFGAVIVALSVANRHNVRLVLDPFINRDTAYSVQAPLFLCLFAALFAGVILGGCAMWLMQGRWRRQARTERREAAIWRREAENLKRGLQSGNAVRLERGAAPGAARAFR
jgi:hypothetical protein